MSSGSVFIGIGIVVIIGLVILIIGIATRTNDDPNPSGPIGPKNSCYVPQSKLPEISDNLCCVVGQRTTGWRRYGDNITSPTPTPALLACGSFCNYIDGASCSKDTPADKIEKFNQCMSSIQPINCKGQAYPVARVGSSNYYIVAYPPSICNSWTDCL